MQKELPTQHQVTTLNKKVIARCKREGSIQLRSDAGDVLVEGFGRFQFVLIAASGCN